METFKLTATIDGALYEVEAKQLKQDQPRFELIHQEQQLACLHKENGKWIAETADCLMPDEVDKIGKAIDECTHHQFG